jgi:hypothetical protein
LWKTPDETRQKPEARSQESEGNQGISSSVPGQGNPSYFGILHLAVYNFWQHRMVFWKKCELLLGCSEGCPNVEQGILNNEVKALATLRNSIFLVQYSAVLFL